MQLDSEDCLRQVMSIHGVLGASLVDYQSGLTINSAGREPAADEHVTAAGVSRVVSAVIGDAPFASTGFAGRIDDLVLTAGNGYHLVFVLECGYGSPLVLYVWLDRLLGNLAMTQRRIHGLTDGLVTA